MVNLYTNDKQSEIKYFDHKVESIKLIISSAFAAKRTIYLS